MDPILQGTVTGDLITGHKVQNKTANTEVPAYGNKNSTKLDRMGNINKQLRIATNRISRGVQYLFHICRKKLGIKIK